MIKKLQVSKLFLLALMTCYFYVLVAMYLMLTIPDSMFDTDNPGKVLVALKLSYVRLLIAAVFLFGYPIVLFRSLKYAKHLTIAITTWTIAMYIDDYLVLYQVLEDSKRGLVIAIIWLRPILIICLIWMSFELTYSKPKVE